MTKLEEIARALRDSEVGPDVLSLMTPDDRRDWDAAWATMPAWQRDAHLRRARVAVGAMRMPSQRMLVEAVDGAGRMPDLSDDMDFTEVWQAMIDAILNERGTAR